MEIVFLSIVNYNNDLSNNSIMMTSLSASVCSNLPSSVPFPLQQWGGFIGPALAVHRGPSAEKHHLTQQIGTSSAAYGNTHHLHSWPASLV